MTFSEDLSWRGLIKDKTFDDISWLNEPKVFYHGIDPSADSMTIGNLAAMILTRRFIDAGWKAVLLAGGATSLVGDPGGKSAERDLKPRAEIEKNIVGIKAQINSLFSGRDFALVDNYDWFKDIGYLDFLREIGKHYSMTELMQRDFVTDRMGEGGSGISYAEFSYSLVQGYDFWHLYKNHQVVLQVGGSDQWGNMLSGVPLVRKKENAEVHAMSMPLVINKTTGVKFGKSERGAIWLDPSKTTPTEFYQFWVNASDEDVEDYLKIFTFLSKEDIEQLMVQQQQDPTKRLAQTRLAGSVTDIVHGEQLRRQAEVATRYLTSQVSLAEASEEELEELKKSIPSMSALAGDSIVAVLVNTQLASSNSDARRLLQGGAIYINGVGVSRDKFESKDFHSGRLLLRRGKAFKDSALVELK